MALVALKTFGGLQVHVSSANGTINSEKMMEETMKKFDAQLVLLAKENTMNFKLKEDLMSPIWKRQLMDTIEQPAMVNECNWKLFRNITDVKLQMEALILLPIGAERMELKQADIRPIFTVECQLSNELIRNVPRYELFNIMQFESDKFQTENQCTRFGQVDQRSIRLPQSYMSDKLNKPEAKLNLGRLQFTVWWREAGTCLNEILGMGVLELYDMYQASLLEQCKCIDVVRREVHLGKLYFKISLLCDLKAPHEYQIIEREVALHKQKNSADNRYDKDVMLPPFDADNPNRASGSQNRGAGKSSSSSSSSSSTNTSPSYSSNCDFGAGFRKSKSGDKDTEEESADEMEASGNRQDLLHAVILVTDVRDFTNLADRYQLMLICRRFWTSQPAACETTEKRKFKYYELFTVKNDTCFLERTENQYLNIDLWSGRYPLGKIVNREVKMKPYGLVRIPLHPFFIAYNNSAIRASLSYSNLPVVSMDGFAPIYECENGDRVGVLNCLFAIGTETQIYNLLSSKGDIIPVTTYQEEFLIEDIQQFPFLQLPKNKNNSTKQPAVGTQQPVNEEMSTFKIGLEIYRAIDLPTETAPSSGKQSKRIGLNYFPIDEPPNTYVIFSALNAIESNYAIYGSSNSKYFATKIIRNCTSPCWHQKFRITISRDYMLNPNRRFVLSVHKRSTGQFLVGRDEPNLLEDPLIGVVELNLNDLLLDKLIHGWHNIVDSNGEIRGHLEVRAYRLSNISIEHKFQLFDNSEINIDAVIRNFQQKMDLMHLDLIQEFNRLLQKKYEELGSMNDRLNETSHRLPTSDSDMEMEEFEHDINTIPFEEEKSDITNLLNNNNNNNSPTESRDENSTSSMEVDAVHKDSNGNFLDETNIQQL